MKICRKTLTVLLAAFTSIAVWAKSYTVTSPDGMLEATVDDTGKAITLGVSRNGVELIKPSRISLDIEGRKDASSIKSARSRRNVTEAVDAEFYRQKHFDITYNELSLRLDNGTGLELRVFNDGVAYRYVTRDKGKSLTIAGETAQLDIPGDPTVYLPYTTNDEKPMAMAFQNIYDVTPLSHAKDKLIFLPATVDYGNGLKLTLLESDLEAYPGMWLKADTVNGRLDAKFAPYPVKTDFYPWRVQEYVTETAPYIALADGARTYPWRIMAVTTSDTQMPVNNLVYALASPSRVPDTSWIKTGKVAWDWWNDWNLAGVDFRAGVNTETYKYYIDFAAAKGIEYVILDEGWAVNGKADLMQVVPEIDLEEIVAYGASKNVGIILWAGYWAFDRDMERVCEHYAEMGVKGFKVDFMDRDDQRMTAFNHRAAETAARYGLVLDLHGTHKPAGLNRTWPNVLNFEGVYGLEQMKWCPESVDQMKYDATIPFVRQAAGPMDYTQGAMRNASRGNYRPVNTEPMSQGTRCHQLALYVVLDSPLNMLCDSPTNYLCEPECTEFIAAIPTVWDETRILGGRMGEYIVTARRSGDTWYVGGITNWTPRDVEVDLAPLGIEGAVEATLFRDGANADRKGSDYKRETIRTNLSEPLKVHLAPGGGFAVKVGPAKAGR